jgi:catechol 2,3-dioxygenase-like lactoylglutathione lyase family enzyme
MKGLWHVALRVRDAATMRDFYVNLLGYEVEWEPDPANLYLSRGRDNLALHVDPGAPAAGAGARAGGALDHLGFVVDSPEDVDAWAERLVSHGVALEQAVRTHRDGARSFYARDPEGNLLQFICHPPLRGR